MAFTAAHAIKGALGRADIRPVSPTVTADALAAVRRLSFAALQAQEPREIEAALAGELFGLFAVDQVHISWVAQDGSMARGTKFVPGPVAELEWAFPFDGPSGVKHVLETCEPLNVSDAAGSPLVSRPMIDRFGLASLVYVPLAFEGEVRSVAILCSETPQEFDDAEVEVAYTLSNQAAAALRALEMKGRLQARAEQQTALARSARALNARLDTRAVLDTLCHEADLALGGDLAGVYLGDAGSGGVAVAAHGIHEDSNWWGYTIRPGEGVGGQVLVSGEPVVSNAYQTEVDVPRADVLQRIQTAVSVPVRWSGQLKGALSVAFFSMRRVSGEDIETLGAIADLAAVACSNAEEFERAQAAARTDSLTGFLNHGAVQVRLRDEIWRARRSGAPLSCLLVDLDNFKPINDRHGHLVGDEILQHVSTAIAAEFRAYDGIARYGGDEFVLVLPGTDAEDAREAAARLRRAVAEAGVSFSELGTPFTASVGLAQWHEPLTAGELLDRADRALLLAKQRGKDAIVVATADTERELSAREAHTSSATELMGDFWDMVSSCERPRDLLHTLPALLRRTLELEETALYELGPRAAVRLSSGRAPGDPAPRAFAESIVVPSDALAARLDSGAVSRPSLPALLDDLGAPPAALDRDPPHGACAAIVLACGEGRRNMLLLRSAAVSFPRPALRLAELVGGQAMTVLLGQTGGGSPGAVTALAAAIDARDNYTRSHSEEVVGLACEVARHLGLSPDEVEHVRDGAMLHDVGKVAIPNEILYKVGPLSEGEWEIMREHPLIGERILRRTPELAEIAPLVRHEHERWDGRGYPDGLAGAAIPIGSRIVFACDAYNAMITARPYREPMSHDDAVAELRRGAGSQFDPQVVEALLHVLAARAVARER
jgi:diguanylate cyclase (GGDEF)-like protein